MCHVCLENMCYDASRTQCSLKLPVHVFPVASPLAPGNKPQATHLQCNLCSLRKQHVTSEPAGDAKAVLAPHKSARCFGLPPHCPSAAAEPVP